MRSFRGVRGQLRILWIRRAHFATDVCLLASAFSLAYLLRFDFAIPANEYRNYIRELPVVVGIQLLALLFSGVYMYIWRYIGLRDVMAFGIADCVATIPLFAARFYLPNHYQQWRVPLSIIVADAVLMFGATLGVRVARRAIFERSQQPNGVSPLDQPRRRVLLIGAGRAGRVAVEEIRNRRDSDLEVVGFVDDEGAKQHCTIHNVSVLGTTEALPWLVREHQIDHVIITFTSAGRDQFRRILDICESIPVKVRTIPSLYEVLQGNVKVSRIRDLEISDLLGREEVHLDEVALAKFIQDKTVMVTGAGGSIGSELAHQVARYRPLTLLLVERSEPALFRIDSELRRSHQGEQIVPIIADVGNEGRMRFVLSRYHPDVIIHAAAHKHVPMMEINALEAISNNVLATRRLAQLAGEFKTGAFVMVSTDKAVRATSVMGASKRVAELLMQAFNLQYVTRFVAVRFGNVIGSTGSVIPIFYEQIRKGGPVTVTHPDMVRYFMTIPEASQLVLQAAAMASGGEIFVLDMGKPVRILDLAKDVIRLAGLKPYEDIDIVFTGVRNGEKLIEELQIEEERMAKTRHPKIYIGDIALYPPNKLHEALQQMELLCHGSDDDALLALLQDLLPDSQLARRRPIVAIPATALSRSAALSFD